MYMTLEEYDRCDHIKEYTRCEHCGKWFSLTDSDLEWGYDWNGNYYCEDCKPEYFVPDPFTVDALFGDLINADDEDE